MEKDEKIHEEQKEENKTIDVPLLSIEYKEWLLSQLPLKVVTLTLLFRGTTHGWSPSNFHQLCDEKGPTITIFKSKAAKVFGGFT
jgi:hypothetical protein